MIDAFNVCGHAIPDRERVAACLAPNIKRISGACRTVMQRYRRPASTARQAVGARLIAIAARSRSCDLRVEQP